MSSDIMNFLNTGKTLTQNDNPSSYKIQIWGEKLQFNHIVLCKGLLNLGQVTWCWTGYMVSDRLHGVEQFIWCWTGYMVLDMLHGVEQFICCWTVYMVLDRLHGVGQVTWC